ncbi:MAG: response regulator transcription factor [Anaerolineae bacterium]
MAKILVIDDDAELLQLLQLILNSKGYDVVTSASGENGLSEALKEQPDLVILDFMMPVMDGVETCRQLRTLFDIPILMLTARSDEASMVRSLEAGADDYVVKPCDGSILLAKVRALLRRAQSEFASELIYQDDYLTLNLTRGEVRVNGHVTRLTPTELRLLTYLFRNADRVVPHDELVQEIWGGQDDAGRRLLKLYVLYLRRKLERNPARPNYVRTAWGVGYRFHGLGA